MNRFDESFDGDLNDTETADLPSPEEMGRRIVELAPLGPLAYDQRREAVAKELGVRVSTLDAVVRKARGGAEGEAPTRPEPVEMTEPWPQPVDGGALAEELRAALLAHVVFPSPADAGAAALWIMGTWLMDLWRLWPKLFIRSPEKRCGKTTLLEVVEAHVSRGLMTSNISAAALFRSIEEWSPTLVIDEADRFLKDNEEANGIVNAGHTRRSARVVRVVEENRELKPRAFSVWGAQAIASIGAQMDTLEDRSIRVDLQRRLPSETIEPMGADYFERRGDARRRLARWAKDVEPAIAAAAEDPTVRPRDSGNDRARDNWTPLFRIAAALGGLWPERVAAAYAAKTARDDDDEPAGVMALRDVMACFEASTASLRGSSAHVDRLPSSHLVDRLTAMDDRPWAEWRRGLPLTATGLAKLLRRFGIKPINLRIEGRVAKGYERDPVEAAFDRYCR